MTVLLRSVRRYALSISAGPESGDCIRSITGVTNADHLHRCESWLDVPPELMGCGAAEIADLLDTERARWQHSAFQRDRLARFRATRRQPWSGIRYTTLSTTRCS